MSADVGPLAALLASHPEECAAVVAALVSEGSTEGTGPWSCVSIAIEVDVPLSVVRAVVLALIGAHVVQDRGDGCTAPLKADRRAIARMGAAAWLRGRLSLAPREARYVDREAITARVAAVLGCRVDRAWLGWESSRLSRIEVGGRGLDGDDIAALIRAGFEPSPLGWDVPGDCGEAVGK